MHKRFLCMHKNLVRAQQLPIQSVFFCQSTFFHEWASYGRWGGHRTAEFRVMAVRVFVISMISQKNRFSGPWTFHDFSDIFRDL